MNAKPEIPATEKQTSLRAGILMRFVQIIAFFILQAFLLFISAGKLTWIGAWAYLGIGLLSVLINSVLMLRKHPETIAERGRPQWTKKWDKFVAGLWSLVFLVGLPLVAGLDIRYGWTGGLGTPWLIAGGMVLALGYGLSGWAMVANAYFSTAVRIQSDRGHTVCRSGPYRFVRHPGYVGFILQSLGAPILLDSFWALAVGLTAAALIVIRMSLEDRMLQAELPGYRDYVREVRFRLVPGIW